MRYLRFVSIAMVGALTGCGQVAGSDYEGEPLATLHGQVVSEAALDASTTVGIALVWFAAAALSDSGGSAADAPAYVAQEASVSTSFPAAFALDVEDPPPVAARLSYDASTYFAIGIVLAYADGDGNGRLDLPSTLAESSPDRILGSVENRLINFYQGEAKYWLVPGFSYFVYLPAAETRAVVLSCFDSYDGDDEAFRACMRQLGPFPPEPIGTPVTITLHPEGDPAGICYGVSAADASALAEPVITCDADRRGFTASTNPPVGAQPGSLLEACYRSQEQTAFTYRLPAAAPIPPSPWPC